MIYLYSQANQNKKSTFKYFRFALKFTVTVVNIPFRNKENDINKFNKFELITPIYDARLMSEEFQEQPEIQ